jgi:exonuclease SbcC
LACYGPRFSVRLETQSEKTDGTLKETFDITVFDSVRDESKSIRDMSGGEVTTIEDAITRAICLYNLGKSNIIYDTLYSDEKDGALDASRKIEFLQIKRRAMEIGTHRQELFISQTPELHEMADARIVLTETGVTIR